MEAIVPKLRAHHKLGWAFLFFALFLPRIHPSPPVPVAPGPQQTVESAHPLLAVHTRLADEVEEWKIKRSLELVREMGATSIIEFFPWAYYQGEDRNIAWGHADMVINHAATQGLTVVARIGLTPDWARPPETPLTYLDADAYDNYAAFAAAFAERYRGKVDYLIIGNESNLSYEWGYRKTTPQDYVELLEAVYPAVKASNPDITVLAGALAPTLEPPESPWGENDLSYLRGMYEAGAAAYFDGLAVHSYGLTFPPQAEPDAETLNFRRVELLREIMVEYGDEETAVYITEMGWNDHPRWTRGVRPAQRIHYTIDALEFVEEEWPYVKMAGIWVFRTPAPTKSYMDYYSLVTPEFVEKPIYGALKEWATSDE